ncbi:MAG: sigma-70 family RNA polymerase sigma factor [Actinomycetota bacterium]|nr:sigma-70 family RNA polymerase sigma factor [Actinomycetota bacterium]
MATVVKQKTMSDAELIVEARTGAPDAYAELYRRHVGAARAAARALCRNRSDADDVVSEAFAKVLRVLQNGNGPEVAFRPYLLTSVRNCFYDKTRRQREEPTDEPTEELGLILIDSTGSDDDTALAALAFATLPERWQLVLWHTEVEGRSPAEVAPLLGLAPSAVAALAYRAREGLRQAFLQAHLRTPRPSDCRECAGNLGAYVRDGLSSRDRRRVDEHLEGCESCQALLIELTDTNTTLRVALIPAIVGVPVAAYLSGLGGKGAMAWFARLPRRQQAAAGTAAAAVAVVAAVVVAAVVSAGGNSPTIAAPTTTRPPAVVATEVEPIEVEPIEIADAVTSTIDIASADTTPAAATQPLVESAPPVPTTTPTRGVSTTTAPVAVAVTTIPATPTTAAPTVAVAPPPVPTTTAPATTAAPTTTVPITPRLAIASTQLGTALIGGQARVQVAVSATVLPTNQFRTDALATNLVVSVSLPAGVTLVSATNPAWSCTSQGTCTIATLVSGSSSTAVLRLGIAPTAVSPISFAPTITVPANAVVQAPPILIEAVTVPGLEHFSQQFARGSVAAIGNTVMRCEGNGCGPVDVDKDDTTFNSSTADLSFTGTVAEAWLVWSGDSSKAPTPADRDTVKFITPDGLLDLVAADDDVVTDYPSQYAGAYVAYMDVTGWMATAGTYGVANIQTSSYGGWSLIIITHDDAQPERSLMFALPLSYVTKEAKITFPGASSSSTVDAHVVVSAFEGDEKIGGTAKLNAVDLAGPDAFSGRIVSVPRNPNFDINRQVDVLDVNATDIGAGDVTLAFATTEDAVMIAAVGIALDLS